MANKQSPSNRTISSPNKSRSHKVQSSVEHQCNEKQERVVSLPHTPQEDKERRRSKKNIPRCVSMCQTNEGNTKASLEEGMDSSKEMKNLSNHNHNSNGSNKKDSGISSSGSSSSSKKSSTRKRQGSHDGSMKDLQQESQLKTIKKMKTIPNVKEEISCSSNPFVVSKSGQEEIKEDGMEATPCPPSPQRSVVSCDALEDGMAHSGVPVVQVEGIRELSPNDATELESVSVMTKDVSIDVKDENDTTMEMTKQEESTSQIQKDSSSETVSTEASKVVSMSDTTMMDATSSDSINASAVPLIDDSMDDGPDVHAEHLDKLTSHLPQDLQIHIRGLKIESNLSPMKLLLNRLIIHPTYNRRGTFNKPVDPVAFGLKDYFTIIKKPMDLGTIKAKLLSNIYTHHSHVARDIRLVFHNACKFNPPKHPVHEAAKGLLEYFEDGYAKILIQSSPMIVNQGQKEGPSLVSEPFDDTNCALQASETKNSPLVSDRIVSSDTAGSQQRHFVSGLNLPPIKHTCTACEGNICPICEEGCQSLEHSLLICAGHQCLGSKIRRGVNYYCSKDGTKTWCHKCYSNLPPVLSHEDEFDGTVLHKRDLLKRKNDEDVAEKWIKCGECKRSVHRVCAFASEFFTNDSTFVCPLCTQSTLPLPALQQQLESQKKTKSEVGLVYSFLSGKEQPELVEDFITGTYMDSRNLPNCNIASFIETKVKERMVELECLPGSEETVTIRVIGDYSKKFDLPDVILRHYRREGAIKEPKFDGIIDFEEPPSSVTYQSKVIAMFQRIDGMDVCIFSMFVQEYDECVDDPSQKKRVYIAYIDSVEHFRPRSLRTHIYKEILTAYLATAKARGFEYAHIWSCPPTRGNSFVFWMHPPSQRTPSKDHLLSWYHNALSLCMERGVITNIKSLYDHSFQQHDNVERLKKSLNPLKSVMPCPPILEGDFWVEETMRIHASSMIRFSRSQKKTGTKTPEFQPSVAFADPHSMSPVIQVITLLEEFIMKHPSADPFLRPVNTASLGLHDYNQIIKTPMDLGTIFTKCILGEYEEFEEFCFDLNLVYANAMKYNPKEHPVHKQAEEMRKYSQDLLQCLTQHWSSLGIRPLSDEQNQKPFFSPNPAFQRLSMKLSTIIGSPADQINCNQHYNNNIVNSKTVGVVKDPNTIMKEMVGADTWLLDKKHDSKKKAKAKKKRAHPCDHYRREYWVSNEVLSAVRKLRTDFFVCSLAEVPESSLSSNEAAKTFSTYVKNFKMQEPVMNVQTTRFTKPEVGESRHGFLELSQYCNFQFDTLRRAKYSTSMLLYYLNNPSAPGIVPTCSTCSNDISNVRWHRTNRAFDERRRGSISIAIRTTCVEMAREDLCSECYGTVEQKDDYIPIRVSYNRVK